jgi:N-methylhydantoinase A
MGYRLGVDVGGTFTDLLLIDESTGETFRAKVPSTPSDQSVGVLAGIEKICALANIAPSQISELMHGTTVATNAVLEGKGARVGLITTEGYRQVLQIARSFVPGGLAGWIVWPKPKPLAALENTFEVKERIGARGEVVRPLNEQSAEAALRGLMSREVETVTVSLINSFANDAHERRIGKIAERVMPDVTLSLSCDVLPEMREYERALTTVANSYVKPVVARYLSSLENQFAKRGLQPRLKMLRSDGGLMSFAAAKDKPVNMLMSGPAGGVAGALWAANQADYRNVLTLDMGGTSTDVALIEGGSPRTRRETMVGDVSIRASSLDVRTVGAGGGSIAIVPELTRALRVGPQSAGAEPGPAAYGKGGTQATVTDANVVLGYLPAELLGGEIKLDRRAARVAVQKIADALGLGLMEAASGIVDIVNEHMFGALRLVSVEQGYDPREFALIAFGGAGPLHANALGRLLNCWPVIIPPSPGVLCAYGEATTRPVSEAARTFIRRFSESSADGVMEVLRELGERAVNALVADGVPRSEHTTNYQIDVRYHGQGFEVTVPIDVGSLEREGFGAVGAAFDAIHQRLFTFALEVEHEMVNLRVIAQGKAAAVKFGGIDKGDENPSVALCGNTSVWVDGRLSSAKVYERARLRAGNIVRGPAIVTEMDSTTLVLPHYAGEIDSFGNILIRPAVY